MQQFVQQFEIGPFLSFLTMAERGQLNRIVMESAELGMSYFALIKSADTVVQVNLPDGNCSMSLKSMGFDKRVPRSPAIVQNTPNTIQQ
jgi:hypothetical protein